MEEQTLYDELVNGLREIEKNVITDLNAGQASGSWMGRIGRLAGICTHLLS